MALKDDFILTPGSWESVTLKSKRHFADGMKLRILRRGGGPGLF